MSTKWLDKIKVVKEPIPHIPQKLILQAMPDALKPEWENFIMGQTGLHCENGDFGVYEWDFERFAGRVRKGSKILQDTVLEWD